MSSGFQTPPPQSPLAPESLLPPVISEPLPNNSLPVIAPLWHTAILIIVIVGVSFLSAKSLAGAKTPSVPRIALYLGTIIQDGLLLLFVWFGLYLRKIRLRDLIGGPWNRIEDFLLDTFLVAPVFWIVSAGALVGLRFALGLGGTTKNSMDSIKASVGTIAPQTVKELLVFVALALMAGFFEEILFRGYMQQQLAAITRNSYVGLALSAVLFGAAHGYQGTRFMVLIGCYGIMFGLLAHFRKSLRPGMMAHAFQDAAAGIGLFLLSKSGMLG